MSRNCNDDNRGDGVLVSIFAYLYTKPCYGGITHLHIYCNNWRKDKTCFHSYIRFKYHNK